jgi:hypothetical protein
MMYAIEFIREVDGNAAEQALGVTQLVSDGIMGVVEQAEALYRKLDTIPRPNGFRIRDDDGATVHEFHERETA